MVRCISTLLSFNLLTRHSIKQQYSTRQSIARFRQYSSVAMGALSTDKKNELIKKFSDDIVKSEQDKRSYRGLELHNGLKVLLVSDPTTDKSSAALDVHIGSMSNPKELPGLAHFLEHMLFLGTEKYPSENEYNKFLSMHGGSSNAYTAADHTNYFFDVTPNHLSGALDRFAQFFLGPLFTESATDREVKAVNSEHEKNLQSDAWRLNQLEKATSDPEHDFSKFGTGNIKTLDELPKSQGINVRQRLLEFHDKWYSSNIMALAILGKESLDELTDMTLSLFADIKNKNVILPEWNSHPFRDEDLRQRAYVVPVKDLRNLNITFPIPDLHPFYRSGPGHYLGHLIGHEGPGSLLSELKSRGWVNTIVGGQQTGAKGFGFFIVNVDLTEEGINHVDDIVSLMFQYFNMLREEGPQQWIFDECKDLATMTYRFKDKERPESYTTALATSLHDYPMEEVLSGPYLLHEYQPEQINMVLERLIPEKIRMAVIGKQFENICDVEESWYGTKYKNDFIKPELIAKWSEKNSNKNLRLPDKNDFVPTDFKLVERERQNEVAPAIIKNTEMSRVWFKQDHEFLLPKSVMNFLFISPLAYVDPQHSNMTYMFVKLFNDALNEYTYAATLAGLSYNLSNSKYGMFLSIKGYNHKQSVLLEKIIDCMTDFKIDPKRFEILKENYIRRLKNFHAEQPHQHAIYYASLILAEGGWSNDELLKACEELTVEKMNVFIPQLLSMMYIESLCHGNLNEKQAISMSEIIEQKLEERLSTKPLCPSQLVREREGQLPNGCNYVYEKDNSVHSSSSIESYYQCGLQSSHSNILVELFAQIISEPCFNILRTQEQLGYIVFSGVRSSYAVKGLRIIVQSDRTPDYVDSRIETFLSGMEEYIKNLSDEDFEQNKMSLAEKRLEKPKKLSQQSGKYWWEILSQQYNFNRDAVEVEELKNITKDEVLQFHKDLISYDSPIRHKLSIYIKSTASSNQTQETDKAQTEGFVPVPELPKAEMIEDITSFKRSLGLFPLVKPYTEVPKPVCSTKSKL